MESRRGEEERRAIFLQSINHGRKKFSYLVTVWSVLGAK